MNRIRRVSRIAQHLSLTIAFLLAALARGHADTVTFSCTGQMRVIKQYKNSDLGERDTFPFTEKVIVDFGARTAEIGGATFPNLKITDDRIEGKLGTFALGAQSDSFEIDMKNGTYHHMTRVPSGDYDLFYENALDGSICTKSQQPAKGP
jgi:hypothetical protein